MLHADYLRTARAKGLKEWTVIARHGLKNALIPIITVVAFRMSYLIGGAVIIETVFQWPGLGLLTLERRHAKGLSLDHGARVDRHAGGGGEQFLADVAYSLIDPRIRIR